MLTSLRCTQRLRQLLASSSCNAAADRTDSHTDEAWRRARGDARVANQKVVRDESEAVGQVTEADSDHRPCGDDGDEWVASLNAASPFRLMHSYCV